MEPIILASGSRRRQEYFKLMGLPFSIINAEVDEESSTQTDPQELSAELAVKKVEKAIEVMKGRLPNWICGADTVVSCSGKIFGKPANREDAIKMLETYSNKEHNVFTSIALYNKKENKIDCRSANSSVVFAPLSQEEIQWYISTNEWQRVAGAYKLQGLASCFITKITGAPSTVIGLPLQMFYNMLRDNGYKYGG